MPNTQNHASITDLEPRPIWNFFAGIAAVPRPSKQEQRVREHLLRVLAEHKLPARTDDAGNVVADVSASPGRESAPVTVLQSHLDMVCEKNAGTAHDFDRDPIRMVVDREPATGATIVRAEGTTLGADNGIGVAMALAAATTPNVVHGPLELLFTVDEEAGMSGAKGLTPQSFRGRRLINLDSEEDDRLYIGCAGGCDTTLTFEEPLTALETGTQAFRVTVRGLRGGHSGSEIHEGRGNAIKLLARTLQHASVSNLRIAALAGGSKRNAIPREAEATVYAAAGARQSLEQSAARVQAEAAQESAETGATITVETITPASSSAAGAAASARWLAVLAALPHGVLGMHPRVPGLVETSSNVAIVESRVEQGRLIVVVATMSRSSSPSRLHEVLDQIAGVAALAGAARWTGNDYPPWEPNPDSPLLGLCRKTYERLFGSAPHVAAIHAGLECGIIGERVGGVDMVSLGPLIRGAHSPDERVYVDSVQKSWQLLKAVLGELARG